MKRLVVLLFGLVGAALFMSAANSGDRVLRDSIFHVYRSMPADTTRTVFAKEAAMGHVKESWALELLDSALVFAREIKDVEGELELQYGIFRYYTFRMDGENMEKTCATLREACYRYKKFDNYFLALHYVLQRPAFFNVSHCSLFRKNGPSGVGRHRPIDMKDTVTQYTITRIGSRHKRCGG